MDRIWKDSREGRTGTDTGGPDRGNQQCAALEPIERLAAFLNGRHPRDYVRIEDVLTLTELEEWKRAVVELKAIISDREFKIRLLLRTYNLGNNDGGYTFADGDSYRALAEKEG